MTEQRKSWRDTVKIHPAAAMFPPLSSDELRLLADDIQANGLQHRVVMTWIHPDLPDGSVDFGKCYEAILNGCSRLDAMELLGWSVVDAKGKIKNRLKEFFSQPAAYLGKERPDTPDDADPDDVEISYVRSANIHRRHLKAADRRDLIAKLLKANPETSNRQIAATVKVDDKTVGTVRAELERSADIPHVATVVDKKGRKQPAKKSKSKRQAAAEKEQRRVERWRQEKEERDRVYEQARCEVKAAVAAAVALIRGHVPESAWLEFTAALVKANQARRVNVAWELLIAFLPDETEPSADDSVEAPAQQQLQ